MRPSYLKNAALLTGADVVLRLAGMGLRIWLANALGGEGMGLYQLVLAVYSLFVTLATSGVSVAATRLMAEELSRSRAEARGMLLRLLGAALLLGSAAWAGQFGLAELAAAWWLGDVRAAGALRAAAFGLPWMAVSAVLRGFFIARRQVGPNVVSQLVEQMVRISAIWFALERGRALDVGGKCTAVLAATALSETVSACLMLLFYRREAVSAFGAGPARRPMDPAKRLWEILWPVEGGRCLASALHTAENMLVPACLTVYLLDAGGRSAAVAQYGNLKGMALPLLTFPFGLLGSLSVLLMPEITQAHIRGETGRLSALLDRMLRLTGYFSALAGAVFWVWGAAAARLFYGPDGAEAGFYLTVLGPAMPLMYLESMVDGAMKGVGEQKAVFRYSLWDAVLRIAGVMVLLPRFGMKGFLFVILLSSVYTCLANTARLLRVSGMRPALMRWLGAPLLAAGVSAGAGVFLREMLSGWQAGEMPEQLAALCIGCCGMGLAGLAAAWPLGLGVEVRAALHPDRVRQKGQDLMKSASAARDRVRRKLAAQEKELAATRDRERLRISGELITANLYRMERGMARLEAENYYEEGCPRRVIPLDVRLSPQENAAKYFKRYNKAKTAEKMLAQLMAQGREELAYLESVLQEIQQAESEQDFNDIRAELTEGGYIRSHGRKQPGFQRKSEPRHFRTDAGLLVLVGRSNRQNDKLTGKTADRTDWWFHTQKIHGSHVILCTNGVEPDEGSILQAAQLAAYYSQGRDGGKVAVDYTPVKYVKKPAGARPGMVVYTTYRTILAQPDGELAQRLAVK